MTAADDVPPLDVTDRYDREAVRLAFVGLRCALGRCRQAMDDADSDGASVAAIEFTNWTCAVDERLWTVDGYRSRREADPHGAVINGLRWVRDRHMHQVVVADRVTVAIGPGISVRLRWAPVHTIKEPGAKRRSAPSYSVSRTAYSERINSRPVAEPLVEALAFLEAEYDSLGFALEQRWKPMEAGSIWAIPDEVSGLPGSR